MPALAESWLPAPTQPSCARTLYDFSGGLCLCKAVFSSSPALFPAIVILAKAGCWFELLYRCNGGFFWPSLQLEQSRQSQPVSRERSVVLELLLAMGRDEHTAEEHPLPKPLLRPAILSRTLLALCYSLTGKEIGKMC